MRVKRYVVDTMPDAMHSIRTELGSDAVILSTKEVKVGGFMGMFKKKKIEVVAAVEDAQKPGASGKKPAAPQSIPRSAVPQAYLKAAAASSAVAAGGANESVALASSSANEAAAKRAFAEIAAALSDASENRGAVAVLPAVEDEEDEIFIEPQSALPINNYPSMSSIDEARGKDTVAATSTGLEGEVLREIRDMKQWMERIARYSSGAVELPEQLEQLRDQLIEQETDVVLVDEWISNIFEQWSEEGRTWLPQQFAEMLETQVEGFLSGRIANGIAPDTRIVYIAGPTGVGKTTTIAKLAAEQLFKQGRKVGLITSDTYRISAVEQLRTYAAILNMPLEVVQSPGDLQRALFRLEGCDLVLMDTAGRNYRNEMLVAELQSLLARELKSETFLVLSLTSKSRDMKKIAEHFGRYQLDKVIFTKLDETGTYGPLFNVLNDFPLKLSYITNGQNVPDDLLLATKEQISGMILGTGGV
ncbi:flagellar biosynthesis protein FlhF [Paenibacillus sp. P3E]|uniref:flagellar biosynthesis protein FlhF n=1 Tax=unclassified Paenibacillus TaxID=185978 RepID=UPI00093F86A4|nr:MULTISPECIES: flagellar biosynthesis protein FlhF [unclassified Paenibacillus]OKP79037.1 flagellar biosynthesis protein FlhF [Paenibacillus sp. P3E]OKP83801.1 flagellar biosynthesis protein FlhF [Paenibacillus sp. P32E]